MSAFQKNLHQPTEGTAVPTARKRFLQRDILWGKPVFKAPALPNPRVTPDALPFTAARVTHHDTAAVER